LSWLKKLSRWRSPGGQKSMCFEAKGRLQGRASKLLRARRKSRCYEDLGQICLAANGPLVWAVSVGGAVRRYESRYFRQDLSRRTSHHGAIFASPGERYSCPGCRICPEPEKSWQMSEKLIVMEKLSRWRAKIVTSLLPIPALLAHVLILKLSSYFKSVQMQIFGCRK
jgi:hypothetical protein